MALGRLGLPVINILYQVFLNVSCLIQNFAVVSWVIPMKVEDVIGASRRKLREKDGEYLVNVICN